MTKSKIHYVLDTLYYMSLIALPAILLVVVSINGGVTGLSELMDAYTGAFAGTELYTAVNSVIGPGGVAPLLTENTLFFVDWVVLVVYATAFHLLIDALKFIPACAHNLLDRLGGEWFE